MIDTYGFSTREDCHDYDYPDQEVVGLRGGDDCESIPDSLHTPPTVENKVWRERLKAACDAAVPSWREKP